MGVRFRQEYACFCRCFPICIVLLYHISDANSLLRGGLISGGTAQRRRFLRQAQDDKGRGKGRGKRCNSQPEEEGHFQNGVHKSDSARQTRAKLRQRRGDPRPNNYLDISLNQRTPHNRIHIMLRKLPPAPAERGLQAPTRHNRARNITRIMLRAT